MKTALYINHIEAPQLIYSNLVTYFNYRSKVICSFFAHNITVSLSLYVHISLHGKLHHNKERLFL
jgi:hypothetical protein